jgi:hypothetical protein
VSLCLAVIGNIYRITADRVLRTVVPQCKFPRRDLAGIVQGEKKTLRTVVALAVELLFPFIGMKPPKLFPSVSRMSVKVFARPWQPW